MAEAVRYECVDGLATITIDDGKVNVMTQALLDRLCQCIDQARTDQALILLKSGRESVFSAGFDVKPLASGDRAASSALLEAGVRAILALLKHPYPVISLCGGHAYPMGAFLLLASDLRIGVEGDYRIGLNEVTIGIAVPDFALSLARYRLVSPYLHRTAALGQMFGPREAVAAGFLDLLVSREAAAGAVAEAVSQLGKVNMPAHASTKLRLREVVISEIETAARDRLLPTG